MCVQTDGRKEDVKEIVGTFRENNKAAFKIISFLRENGVGMYYMRHVVSQCIVAYLCYIAYVVTYHNFTLSSLLRIQLLSASTWYFNNTFP